ncbi:MAG TPA: GNAT family N-acetyltransferase [Candidatus Acidoferrales bacterium]|nr:GNAT family N-acetyltransferase [Candidatus Acidoferrales bacterium]
MEEITTADGLRRLRPDWNGVEAAGEPINPFLSWDWQSSWWDAFGGDRELHCLVVSEADQVVGIVPLQCASPGPRVFGFGGGADLSDHLGFLFRPDRAAEVASVALEELFKGEATARVAALDLHYLVDASPALTALRQAADQLELGQELTQEEVSPQVSLGLDFEGYLTGRLNKKDRHELRRKLRRLETEQPDWTLVTQADLGLDAALDAFFPLLQASGAHKVEFLTPEVEAFIRSASHRLEERGWLRVQFIKAAGQLTAATLGFTVSDTWHLYNSGYQPEAAALSPGFLCAAEGIRAAIEEGCHTADFLRGSEAYKYHLGAVDKPLWRLQLSRPGGRAGLV